MMNFKSMTASLVLGVATVALMATSGLAMPVTVPTGLNAGDQYRLAFVTSTARDGTSSDIADYNAFVDAIGDTVIVSDWKAIASTSAVSAISNTNTPIATGGIPIYLLNDTKLVDDYADLWDGTLDIPLNINEFAGIQSAVVWTGTDTNGSGASLAQLGTANPIVGNSTLANASWVNFGTRGFTNNQELYGLSSILVVAIPAPGPLGLLAFGLVGLAFTRRKRAEVPMT